MDSDATNRKFISWMSAVSHTTPWRTRTLLEEVTFFHRRCPRFFCWPRRATRSFSRTSASLCWAVSANSRVIHSQHCTEHVGEEGVPHLASGNGVSRPWVSRQYKNPSKACTRTSLVAQRLRICLPMQGTPVRYLVQKDSTCHRATKPMCCNYWSLCSLQPVLCKRSHCNGKPVCSNEDTRQPKIVNKNLKKKKRTMGLSPNRSCIVSIGLTGGETWSPWGALIGC